MEPEFWHQRWQENQIGFHQDEFNPQLQRWWKTLELDDNASVFLPLCGKSRDMLWLAQQGFQVTGIEISPLAVEAFFAENDLSATTQPVGENLSLWRAGNIALYCGDFFDLSAERLTSIDAVFDRAALVALPKTMRQRYVEHLAAILPEHVRMLLVTMEYPQQQMDGPPFSVPETEVRQHYEAHWPVTRLEENDALAAQPGFARRGLSSLIEKTFHIGRPQS